MMRTDPNTLPQYKGHPVPWVARWSSEVVEIPVEVTLSGHQLVTSYSNPHSSDRDSHGVLWMREGTSRGGVPQFGQVSVYRQRACMRRRKCQVCGQSIPPGPLRWLLGTGQLEFADDTAITMSPPTCDACVPLALDMCPFLRNAGSMIVKVSEYRIWGVHGEFAFLRDGQAKKRKNALMQYGSAQHDLFGSSFVAKQQVAEFVTYELQEAS